MRRWRTPRAAGQLDTSERAELTLVLRRRADLPAEIVEGPTVLTAGELAERYGADPADVDLVRQTLTGLGLEVTAVLPATRRIKVAGTLGELSRAFGVTLQLVRSTGPGGQVVTHRYRVGPLYLPAELDGIVVAVLGLDNRPQARSQFRHADRRRGRDLLHSAPGRRHLPVPGRHRRHRADGRDHRARRRLLRLRPLHLLLRARHRRSPR